MQRLGSHAGRRVIIARLLGFSQVLLRVLLQQMRAKSMELCDDSMSDE
jgi:hypothetical protein